MTRRLTAILLLFVLVCSVLIRTDAQSGLLSPEAEFIIGPQVPIGNSWFDQTQVTRGRFHADSFPATPPAEYSDDYVNHHYYDLGLTMYVQYARTGDPADLQRARKVNDSWWADSWWIGSGTVRLWPDSAAPPPRHAGIGGLMLRALDGRPEMWDWIVGYARFHLDLWAKRRINDSELYYGVREGAFALHYAVWLAKALPDSYPNGAQIRAEVLADVENVSVHYFGRLQQSDGSWRWRTYGDDYVDPDGGTLQGVTQPFMIGLLLNALIDVHRLSTNEAVRTNVANQIIKSCRHLYALGPYRTDPVPGLNGERWRDFWYLYHGGTSVNPTKYEHGGQSYTDVSWNSDCGTNAACTVGLGRQAISTIFPAFAYAYLLTGDPFFKAAGEDLYDAAFVGSDGFRGMADGTAKNYNQAYRMGSRYLAWMSMIPGSHPVPVPSPVVTPVPSPSPSPTPISASPDGTKATSITDDSGGVWTLGAQRETLRNSMHMSAGYGSVYKWLSQRVYVLGDDSNWYQWSGSGWVFHGAQEPGTVAEPTPTPAPSPSPTPSATPTPTPRPTPICLKWNKFKCVKWSL